jgi:hypothetical protein
MLSWALHVGEIKRNGLASAAASAAISYKGRVYVSMHKNVALADTLLMQWAVDEWRYQQQTTRLQMQEARAISRHRRDRNFLEKASALAESTVEMHSQRLVVRLWNQLVNQRMIRKHTQNLVVNSWIRWWNLQLFEGWRASCESQRQHVAKVEARREAKYECTKRVSAEMACLTQLVFLVWQRILSEKHQVRKGVAEGRAWCTRASNWIIVSILDQRQCSEAIHAWYLEMIAARATKTVTRWKVLRNRTLDRPDAPLARATLCSSVLLLWKLLFLTSKHVAQLEARSSKRLHHLELFSEVKQKNFDAVHCTYLAHLVILGWTIACKRSRMSEEVDAAHRSYLQKSAQYHFRLEHLSQAWLDASSSGLIAAVLRLWHVVAYSKRRHAVLEETAMRGVHAIHGEADYRVWRTNRCFEEFEGNYKCWCPTAATCILQSSVCSKITWPQCRGFGRHWHIRAPAHLYLQQSW